MTQRTLRPAPTAVPEPATNPGGRTLPPAPEEAETGSYAVEVYRTAEIITRSVALDGWTPTDTRLRQLIAAFHEAGEIEGAVASLLDEYPSFPWGSFAYYVIDRWLYVKDRAERLGSLLAVVRVQNTLLARSLEREAELLRAIESCREAREMLLECARLVEDIQLGVGDE